jgi:hypothetical protein
MEGRRVSRLVASAVRPHPALAVHLARGQVGQGVGPFLDATYDLTEVLTPVTFFYFIRGFFARRLGQSAKMA